MSGDQLLDDPAGLIRETRQNFSISGDLNSLSSIEKSLKQLREFVQEQLEQKTGEVDHLASMASKSESRISLLDSELAEVAGTELNGGKKEELDEIKKELEKLEVKLRASKTELDAKMQELVKEDTQRVEIGNSSDNADVRLEILKLQLYRSLGVNLDIKNRQALIQRPDGQGTDGVDFLPLDGELSEFFKTKFVWDRI
ncbi:LAMI_0G05380g1_1 [Lachancea mirantina]|uniref:Kinetochore protein Spc24 n=1 Tax=Lachancea mirantina TaxID=1230905 RepID=A0A1G4K8X8_9SACH|nr:LAMI_0G05380g1_1 [Lachancea mirantina]